MAKRSHDAYESENTENAYPIDVDSGTEMARLLEQDQIMNRAMGGPISERSDLSGIHRVLDLGCGPAGWAQEIAFAHPKVEVVGVDISNAMIRYARAQAQVQHLDNLTFEVMDITRPLAFPDNSFDLVNARAITGFMAPDEWPLLVQECKRILRPGGMIRLTEAEWGFSNGRAVEKLCSLCTQALFRAGRTHSPNGVHLGVTPVLSLYLRKAGFTDIQKKLHLGDASAGTEGYYSNVQDLRIMFPLLQPFLLEMGVLSSEEEFNHLYREAMIEMLSEDFCLMAYILTVYGNAK